MQRFIRFQKRAVLFFGSSLLAACHASSPERATTHTDVLTPAIFDATENDKTSSDAVESHVLAAASPSMEAEPLDAWVSAHQVAAGEPVHVRCVTRAGQVTATSFTVIGAEVERIPGGFIGRTKGRIRVTCPGGTSEGAADLAAQWVNVEAGEPARWQVNLHRQGACFSQGRLPITWQVEDRFGNEVEDVQIALDATPESGVMRDASGGYLFLDESEYDIALRVVSPPAPNLPVWREHIVVDSTPPRLVFTEPARGAMVQGDAAYQQVTGQLYDKLGPLKRLTINDVDQSLEPNATRQSFTFARKNTWGLNIIDAVAVDACGNEALVSQSYLFSPQYGPAETRPSPQGRVQQGVRALFDQALWDDADRSTSDDVATLLEHVFSSRSLSENLPETLYTSAASAGQAAETRYQCGDKQKVNRPSGFEVRRSGPLTYKAPEVEYLNAIDGGWHLAVSLRDFSLPVHFGYVRDLGCLGNSDWGSEGSVSAQKIRIEARAQIAMRDGNPEITICDDCVEVTFDQARPNINLSYTSGLQRIGLGRLTDRFINWWFRGQLDQVRVALETKVRLELARELERFLSGLRLEHSLSMPAPWRGQLQVASGLSFAALHGPEGNGTGEFGLYGQFFARERQLVAPNGASVDIAEPLFGPIRRDPSPLPPLTLAPGASFSLSIHDDLINQMLWALWYGGVLTQHDLSKVMVMKPTIDPKAGPSQQSGPRTSGLLDAATMRVFFTTPPVVMPTDAVNEIRIGVGDVYAEVELDLYGMFGVLAPASAPRLHAGFYFSSIATAHVSLSPDQLVVTPVGTPELHLQVVRISNPAFQPVVTNWLGRILAKSVPQMLANALGRFPLPTLQIGRMAGVPEDAVWSLHEGVLRREPNDKQIVLSGKLHATHASTPVVQED